MAQSPVDYSLNVAPINPAQQLMQGMAVGNGLLDARETGLQRQQAAEMRPLQMQQAQLQMRTGLAAEADANAARALQQAAAESAAMQAAEMQQRRQDLVNNPLTLDKLQKFTVLYPQEAKAMEDTLKRLSVDERRQFVSDAGQARAALDSGNVDAAVGFLTDRSKARREAGDIERADAMARLAEQAKTQPVLARNMLAAFIAADDPEKFAENETKLATQAATVREGEAKAGSAVSTAKITEAEAKNIVDKLAADLGLTKARAAEIWKNINLGERGMQLKEMESADKAAAGDADKIPRDAQKIVEEVDNYVGNIDRNINKVIAQIDKTGTFELVGPAGAVMDTWLNEIATDLAKLADPGSVARESEVAAQKKNLIDTGLAGLTTRNATAQQVMRELKKGVAERRREAYKARGIAMPAPAFATKYENK